MGGLRTFKQASRWLTVGLAVIPLLLIFQNCGGKMSASAKSQDSAASSSTVGCQNPDDKNTIAVDSAYTYFDRSAGTLADCAQGQHHSVCASDLTLQPVPPAIRFAQCTVVVAAGTSGGGGIVVPVTTPANVLFSEDFESGQIDFSRWMLSTPDCSGSGRISIDSTQYHTGRNSVRVDGGGGYCDHVFLRHTPLTSLGAHFYARYFVRFAQALSNNHTTFMTMTDTGDGGKHLRFGGQSGVLDYNRESNDATLPALSPTGIALSYAPVPNQWTCVEIEFNQSARSLNTWINGNLIAGLRLDQTPTPDVDQQWLAGGAWQPALQDLSLGWESYSGVSNTLWFDDIALSTSPIGCGP